MVTLHLAETLEYTGWTVLVPTSKGHSSGPSPRSRVENDHLPPSICNLGKLPLPPFLTGSLKVLLLAASAWEMVKRGKEEKKNTPPGMATNTVVENLPAMAHTWTHACLAAGSCCLCSERLCGSRLNKRGRWSLTPGPTWPYSSMALLPEHIAPRTHSLTCKMRIIVSAS